MYTHWTDYDRRIARQLHIRLEDETTEGDSSAWLEPVIATLTIVLLAAVARMSGVRP